MCIFFFFFQAEDGIRDAQESRGLGDVYKRQPLCSLVQSTPLCLRTKAAVITHGRRHSVHCARLIPSKLEVRILELEESLGVRESCLLLRVVETEEFCLAARGPSLVAIGELVEIHPFVPGRRAGRPPLGEINLVAASLPSTFVKPQNCSGVNQRCLLRGVVEVEQPSAATRGTCLPPASMLVEVHSLCLLYTSDAADEEDSVDLGGRRIIKKKKNKEHGTMCKIEEKK
eukprot:TRINITY_DN51766_c0_g1_i1.p1 TRINITY_DN51766_c0_g1~~TRINITY_DN51766_c0_g1_i1.p1  ORF type:complete len:229 (-),score=54.52 TRINITY_DN51766_c0_g1_i1:17-703(-)